MSTPGLRPGARPAKRAAIMTAARTVFARDGYARASIDAIASQAGVSTRTIYSHFQGKQELFSNVLQTSASDVADEVINRIARDTEHHHDIKLRLIAIGRALAAQSRDFPEHFAMVRQIASEAPHFPPEIFDAWHDVGPRRVETEVARCVTDFANHGSLTITDPGRAALDLIALTTFEITTRDIHDTTRLNQRAAEDAIAAGVRTFLHGYA